MLQSPVQCMLKTRGTTFKSSPPHYTTKTELFNAATNINQLDSTSDPKRKVQMGIAVLKLVGIMAMCRDEDEISPITFVRIQIPVTEQSNFFSIKHQTEFTKHFLYHALEGSG